MGVKLERASGIFGSSSLWPVVKSCRTTCNKNTDRKIILAHLSGTVRITYFAGGWTRWNATNNVQFVAHNNRPEVTILPWFDFLRFLPLLGVGAEGEKINFRVRWRQKMKLTGQITAQPARIVRLKQSFLAFACNLLTAVVILVERFDFFAETLKMKSKIWIRTFIALFTIELPRPG